MSDYKTDKRIQQLVWITVEAEKEKNYKDSELYQTIQSAIELFDRDKAKPVIREDDGTCLCPECKKPVWYKFCNNCGQRLDWTNPYAEE